MNSIESKTRPDNFDPNIVINKLLLGQLSPARAAKTLNEGFNRQRLPDEEVIDRFRGLQLLLSESNLGLTRRQMVKVDDLIICIENIRRVPEEFRISRNRLVPLAN